MNEIITDNPNNEIIFVLSGDDRVCIRTAIAYYLDEHVHDYRSQMNDLLTRFINIDYPEDHNGR